MIEVLLWSYVWLIGIFVFAGLWIGSWGLILLESPLDDEDKAIIRMAGDFILFSPVWPYLVWQMGRAIVPDVYNKLKQVYK